MTTSASSCIEWKPVRSVRFEWKQGLCSRKGRRSGRIGGEEAERACEIEIGTLSRNRPRRVGNRGAGVGVGCVNLKTRAWGPYRDETGARVVLNGGGRAVSDAEWLNQAYSPRQGRGVVSGVRRGPRREYIQAKGVSESKEEVQGLLRVERKDAGVEVGSERVVSGV